MQDRAPDVYVVEDDNDHLIAACDLLEAAGLNAVGFAHATDALAALDACLQAGRDGPAAVLSDLRMPGMDGFGLLHALGARDFDGGMIVMTGHGDISDAVKAIRAGAEDFLEKPYDAGHLIAVLKRTIRATADRRELARLRNAQSPAPLLGESPAMTALRNRALALAPLDVDIVISGETGTGKELVARLLHAQSPRAGGPFVALNCAALPEAGFEAVMFGTSGAHDAGDPTPQLSARNTDVAPSGPHGASHPAVPNGVHPFTSGGGAGRAGKLESASGGTLVLDEIDMLSPGLQAKLLRVLEQRVVERLGENKLRPLDLRVIAISKANLADQSKVGGFRADLFYRLAGAEIHTPPLREMGGDAALIFAHYAHRAALTYGRPAPDIGIAQRAQLARTAWHGNVRELKAAAERFALGLDAGRLGARAGPGAGVDAPHDPALGGTLADRVALFEAREIARALSSAKGSTERAAAILGLPRRTLADKIKRLGVVV